MIQSSHVMKSLKTNMEQHIIMSASLAIAMDDVAVGVGVAVAEFVWLILWMATAIIMRYYNDVRQVTIRLLCADCCLS
jgi:hypothetical protein